MDLDELLEEFEKDGSLGGSSSATAINKSSSPRKIIVPVNPSPRTAQKLASPSSVTSNNHATDVSKRKESAGNPSLDDLIRELSLDEGEIGEGKSTSTPSAAASYTANASSTRQPSNITSSSPAKFHSISSSNSSDKNKPTTTTTSGPKCTFPLQSQKSCPSLRCIKCDFKCVYLPGREWLVPTSNGTSSSSSSSGDESVYLFFRNNVPDIPKLEKNTRIKKGALAVCCQCSWIVFSLVGVPPAVTGGGGGDAKLKKGSGGAGGGGSQDIIMIKNWVCRGGH